MEKQITLQGNLIEKEKRYFPYSRIKVLKEFYLDYSEIGLSMVELKKKLKLEMHEKTINTSIIELKEEQLILLFWHNLGRTRRRKYYKITERGALYYERFNKR